MSKHFAMAPAPALLVLALAVAMPAPLSAQADWPRVTAIVAADSVDLEIKHSTHRAADGLIISGQTFNSSAQGLAASDLPELAISPSAFVRIVMNPSADSVRVTPVVGGVRQSSQVVESGFQAPSAPGRYEFFVHGWWATHPDGSRPPSGPARSGAWALRLIVR